MTTDQHPTNNPNHALTQSQKNPWRTFGIIVITLAILVLGFWLIKTYLFPDQFTPVSLSVKEANQLNQKLNRLNLPSIPNTQNKQTQNAATEKNNPKPLEPEAYSEVGANHEVAFSEREINAIIAHNTDMADKLAIDLSDNLASAKIIFTLDPDAPMFGGKTVRLNAGVEIATVNNKLVVKLRGVSAWGVPVPNAWLGDMKNVDLIKEFGNSQGFWDSFANGIEKIKVSEGKLIVKLSE